MKTALKNNLLSLLPVLVLLFATVILILSRQRTPLRETPKIQAEPTQPKKTPSPSVEISSEGSDEPVTKPDLDSSLDHKAAAHLEEVFETVAELTGLLDSGESLGALLEIRTLREHPNREVRLSVVEAIRWIGLPAAMDAAIMMDDPDDEIRSMAQETFWGILRELDDDPLKKELLETALSSDDPELRIEVLDELLYLPDALSSNLLMRATNDPNEDVAEQARDNLSFITGE